MTFKDALNDSGFSARQFAKLLGVSRQAVYLWLSGNAIPNSEHLKAIRIIFGNKVIFTKDKVNAKDNCLS